MRVLCLANVNEYTEVNGSAIFGEDTKVLDNNPYRNGPRTLGYLFYRMLWNLHFNPDDTDVWVNSVRGWTSSEISKFAF